MKSCCECFAREGAGMRCPACQQHQIVLSRDDAFALVSLVKDVRAWAGKALDAALRLERQLKEGKAG